MLTLNLQHIPDPIAYLRKQKLRALSLPDKTIINDVRLTTPIGTQYELAKNISNLELSSLIQDLIDETMDALTIWADQKSIYHFAQNHLAPIPTTRGRETL
jgi:hypothetical protein